MRIYAFMVVKNEGDIVEQTLRAALAWASCIAVIDNASADDSWVIIQRLAEAFPDRVLPVGRYDGPFTQDLRLLAFEYLRLHLAPPDWWCRLDADEMYIDDPRQFLAKAARSDCRVNAINLFYEFTDRDLVAWERGDESMADRQRPVQSRRRYYRALYQELRFMRNHPRLSWTAGQAWPKPRGPLSSRHILMQHFRARDPEQLKARTRIRESAATQGRRKKTHHWRVAVTNWKSQIVAAEHCEYDAHDGNYAIDYSRFTVSRFKRWSQWPRRLLTLLGVRL